MKETGLHSLKELQVKRHRRRHIIIFRETQCIRALATECLLLERFGIVAMI